MEMGNKQKNSQFSTLNSRFSLRSRELERLDTGDYTPEEYARWLSEMRLIHTFFGEIRALKKTLLREIDNSANDSVAILDVGAGNGYLLGQIGKRLNGRSPFLAGVEIDGNAASQIRAFGAAPVCADGACLPFAGQSFDYAFCTLLLHHLADADAVSLLSEMARVSRRRIFVVDLNRDRKAYYFYKLIAPVIFQRLTVEDGALSILRSRTPDELRRLAEAAGLRNIKVEPSRLNRLVLSGVSNE
jgi:2-polyprenyl-3-methyl-5-hydroxy-6-metoxy-1,4-benzoquinol methylase